MGTLHLLFDGVGLQPQLETTEKNSRDSIIVAWQILTLHHRYTSKEFRLSDSIFQTSKLPSETQLATLLFISQKREAVRRE